MGEAVANAGYVILVADEMMRYLAASDAACELLGYSREELLSLTVPDLVAESTASALYGELMRDQGQRGLITLQCFHRSSQPRYSPHSGRGSRPGPYGREHSEDDPDIAGWSWQPESSAHP